MNVNRVTSKLMSERSLDHLRTNLSKMNKLQTQLSSGKNINKPSDDPIGLNRLMALENLMKQDERYMKNVDSAKSELTTTDSVLSSVTDIVQRARELTIQASNQTNGPEELDAIKEEISQLQEQIFQVSNTKFGEKYIFGGLRTTVAPFEHTGNDFNYLGTSSPAHKREIEIGDGIMLSVNFAGDNIFGNYDSGTDTGSGLFKTFSDLINRLDTAIAAPNTANYDAIRGSIDDLDTELGNVLGVQTTIGALINRLDLSTNRLEDRKMAINREYGAIQDVDLASVISDLNFQEAVFQTSLSATSRVLKPTLLNYL